MTSQNDERPKEPLILWWMPALAVVAPLIWAGWIAISADSDAFMKALEAFIWPGVLFYLGALAVFWAGWKIELE